MHIIALYILDLHLKMTKAARTAKTNPAIALSATSASVGVCGDVLVVEAVVVVVVTVVLVEELVDVEHE